MCIICEMKRAGIDGADEFGEEAIAATQEAVHDPQLAAGMALMIGALFNKYGIDEFTMSADDFDAETLPAMAFEKSGRTLTARRVSNDEIRDKLDQVAAQNDPLRALHKRMVN